MMDSNLIDRPGGILKSPLKINESGKKIIVTVRVQFCFYFDFGKVYWYLLSYFYRNIPLRAFVIDV